MWLLQSTDQLYTLTAHTHDYLDNTVNNIVHTLFPLTAIPLTFVLQQTHTHTGHHALSALKSEQTGRQAGNNRLCLGPLVQSPSVCPDLAAWCLRLCLSPCLWRLMVPVDVCVSRVVLVVLVRHMDVCSVRL